MDKRTEELIMKRLAAIIVACLIAIPGVTVGPSSRIVRADAPRYTSVPLDSLPLVDSESSNASILTIQNPGHYRDSTLNSGAQLEANCGGADSSATATATFRLHSKYDELSGIIYDTDTNTSVAAAARVVAGAFLYMTASDNRILIGGAAGLFCRNVQLTVRRIKVTAL